MIKKIYILSLLSVFLFSCEEVIEVELEDVAPKLIIDAYFEMITDSNTSYPDLNNGIKLSVSAPYFDTYIPPVSDATVYITNMSNNTILSFIESDTPGFFIPEDTITFIPEANTPYELTVIYNNETYIATTQLVPTPPINSLTQGDGVLFNGDETEIIVEFTDDAERVDYYLFDLDFDLYVLSEDTFYQGQVFNFSYFYDSEVLDMDTITVKIVGIDETYYNYFNLILQQSEQDGNPFQTAPALIKGNIINTTNSDNYAFGYFRISETNSQTITLIR